MERPGYQPEQDGAGIMPTESNVKPPKGGKRRGAGRPAGSGKWGSPTVPVRVPVSLLPAFREWLANQLKTKQENHNG